jgi:hypothetical protein
LGYWLVGLWTPTVNHLYLLSLPFVVSATFLGRAINQRMGADRFLLYVHAGLIAVGIVLLVQTISGHGLTPPHS